MCAYSVRRAGPCEPGESTFSCVCKMYKSPLLQKNVFKFLYSTIHDLLYNILSKHKSFRFRLDNARLMVTHSEKTHIQIREFISSDNICYFTMLCDLGRADCNEEKKTNLVMVIFRYKKIIKRIVVGADLEKNEETATFEHNSWDAADVMVPSFFIQSL